MTEISPDAAPTPEVDVADFARRVSRFLDHIHELAADATDSFAVRIGEHLGTDPLAAEPVSRSFPSWRHADMDGAVEHLVGAGSTTCGVSDGDPDHTLTDLLLNRLGIYAPAAVARETVPVGPGRQRRVITEAVRLGRWEDQPVALLQHRTGDYGLTQMRLEVLCADVEVSHQLLEAVAQRMDADSVLRGQVMTFGASPYEADADSLVTFHPRPQIPQAAVILPEGTLDRVRRHVVGFSELAGPLRQVGQHLSRGVLLYGPPGTGKTHTVRHLIGGAEQATVIILTGEALGAISLAAETARALQPAIVVLEDCDLVAEDRDFGADGRPLLVELLDALDGQAGDADIAFVLTTNRVEVLEPALAQRPGRVDLAVEIPLPDLPARRALFALYAAATGFTEDGVGHAAEITEGITASFVKEAVRRGVVAGLSESREPTDEDLLRAVEELMADQDRLSGALEAEVGTAGVD